MLDTTNYRALLIFFDAIVMTSDGADFMARVSTDGGSTFLSTGTYAHVREIVTSAAITPAGVTGATDTSITVAAAVDSTTAQNLSGVAELIIGGAAAHAALLGAFTVTGHRDSEAQRNNSFLSDSSVFAF